MVKGKMKPNGNNKKLGRIDKDALRSKDRA
jgi:hypothetical protein